MSLILKTNTQFNGTLFPNMQAYIDRVIADGGIIKNMSLLQDAFLFLRVSGLDATKLFTFNSVNWGVKVVSGNVTKLYSLMGASGDLTPKVNTDTFPLVEDTNGVSHFSSIGNSGFTTSNLITTKGFGVFVAYKKNATSNRSNALVAEIKSATSNLVGLNFFYAHNTGLYTINSYAGGTTAFATPSTGVGGIVSVLGGHRNFVNGAQVGESVYGTTTAGSFVFHLAGNKDSGTGTTGRYYANAVTLDITDAEAKAISKFMATFS